MKFNKTINIFSPGKLNVIHKVGSIDKDNAYHDIFSVYLSVSIYDKIQLKVCFFKKYKQKNNNYYNELDYSSCLLKSLDLKIKIINPNISLLPDPLFNKKNNIVYKSIKLFLIYLNKYKKYRNIFLQKYSCMHITIYKNLPIAGGMGGGSSNAAAILIGCNKIWHNPLPMKTLIKISSILGDDVTFFLQPGIAIAKGRGKNLKIIDYDSDIENIIYKNKQKHIIKYSISKNIKFYWVLIFMKFKLSTKYVYETFEKHRIFPDNKTNKNMNFYEKRNFLKKIYQSYMSNSPYKLAKLLDNDLQKTAIYLKPALLDAMNDGILSGAMTATIAGSGPTIALLSFNYAHALSIFRKMKLKRYEFMQIVHSPTKLKLF